MLTTFSARSKSDSDQNAGNLKGKPVELVRMTTDGSSRLKIVQSSDWCLSHYWISGVSSAAYCFMMRAMY